MSYIRYAIDYIKATDDDMSAWTPKTHMALFMVVWRAVKKASANDRYYTRLLASLWPSGVAHETLVMFKLATDEVPGSLSLFSRDMADAITNVRPLDPPVDLSDDFAVPYPEYDAMGIKTSREAS